MNTKIRKQIERRKRQIARRLDKKDNRGCDQPIMTASNIHYEIADRTQATANGGIGAIHLLVRKLGLDQAIDRNLGLLKIHLPYHDSDHVLNIAYNLLAGGTCLEHLELLRSDVAYLNALGARRIPDPTTAGDFCRRFDTSHIHCLQGVFNSMRLKIWRQQPKSFFEEAILDADGTMVETLGECKQGMDINYKGQWGYHPLVISLANTGEPLFVVNRSGNRPSHEQAAEYLDHSIALCRQSRLWQNPTARRYRFHADQTLGPLGPAGREVRLRHRRHEEPVRTGGKSAGKRMESTGSPWAKYEVKTQPRKRPENVKQQVIKDREFKDIRLVKEYVAEFRYRPTNCKRNIASWSCGRNSKSIRARRSFLKTRVVSSTSPTIGRSLPRKSSLRPTAAATKRIYRPTQG